MFQILLIAYCIIGCCIGQYPGGLVLPPLQGVSPISATGIVSSQATGGTTGGGQTYTCVVPGTCPTNNNTNGIDPRIVTPGNNLCPPGLVPCYGRTTQCGIRNVQQANTADGNADPGAYPWQAYLQNSTNTYAGSGVLVDQFHVITAAHKVERSVANPTSVNVIMGVYNPTALGTNTQRSTVSRIILHPQYNNATLRNDIAVLRLTTPIVLGNNINTACLPPAGTSYVGQRCVVSGWGQTAFTTFDAPTNPMKQVYVNIVDYNTCRTSFSNPTLLGANVDLYLDQNNEICAGGQAQRDACTQDGGSPLVCPNAAGIYFVAGLVIWGKNCGQNGVYGVYVSVPAYRNWIDTTIANN